MTLTRTLRTCLWVTTIVIVAPSLAFAQATLAGIVRDSSGGVLPGVSVEVSSPALIERTRSTVTDANGQYQIVDLRPGTYTVTFTLAERVSREFPPTPFNGQVVVWVLFAVTLVALASVAVNRLPRGWPTLLVAVVVGTDGNSPEFQEVLRPGILVDVQGPLGQFTFGTRPDGRRITFLAGGTGIAPLRSMLRHALRDPRHTVALLYSARTPEEFAYYDEFDELALLDGKAGLLPPVP